MRKYEAINKLAGEDEILSALKNDYRRKLVAYRLVDEKFRKKYKLDFQTFEEKNMVKEKDFSWEVESDAIEWEHAIEGIRTCEQKLKELEKL